MAHARRRRRDRGHRAAAHRRRPDAHRASLADDVSPAFLARQRHRSRHRHQRHRHRAVGHPRQDPRRPLPQAVGRPGARLRPHLLPPGRRQDGRLLRDRSRRRQALRRAGRSKPSRKASPRSSRWPCPRRCRSKACGRSAMPRPASGRCATRWATTSTSWSIATPGRRRAWGCSSPRRWSRTACTGSKSRAGPRRIDDIAAIQRAVATPIATGERLVAQHAFRELLEKRACSVLQPDITHCGGLSEARRIAAMAEAYRVALAPHNPQGPVSTAASLEFGFATPSYIICEVGAPRRALAAGRGARRFHGRTKRPDRAARQPTGPGHRDQRGGSEEASVPAGSAATQLLRRRSGGRLVSRIGGVRKDSRRRAAGLIPAVCLVRLIKHGRPRAHARTNATLLR